MSNKLLFLLFSLTMMVVGGLIQYYRQREITEVVTVEVPVVVYQQPQLVTPAADLIAQRTTFKLLFQEPTYVEYFEAEALLEWNQMLIFLDGEGKSKRLIPIARVKNVVRYDTGELWTTK